MMEEKDQKPIESDNSNNIEKHESLDNVADNNSLDLFNDLPETKMPISDDSILSKPDPDNDVEENIENVDKTDNSEWINKYRVRDDIKENKNKSTVILENEIVYDDELFKQEETVLTEDKANLTENKTKEADLKSEKEEPKQDTVDEQEEMSFDDFKKEFEGVSEDSLEEDSDAEPEEPGPGKLAFFLLILLIVFAGLSLALAAIQVHEVKLPEIVISFLEKIGEV